MYSNLERIKEHRPLIHHITNWVTIYDCANITRSFGALPVMAHAKEEVSQMATSASALVLNIGTLDDSIIESMVLAGKSANAKGIPVILDAVGAGATTFRTAKTNELLEKVKIDILKGNAGEIGSIAGIEAEVLGVESISVSKAPQLIAKELASHLSCVIAITGKTDYVSDAKITYAIKNGHELMGKVVGTGCMSTSVIGCFAAVEKDYTKASVAALSCFGIVGELAADNCNGIGSFKENFFDATGKLDMMTITKKQKVSEFP
ncbi:MAG: hydroxyethylthiazole kinase [Candidatus Micrarchaeota archaeon]|nr:hydroxyethylthiazole kinase [Candidatus Micrarchaeota archaeon]